MMQFGMPVLIEAGSPEECAVLCHRLGLSFIELNMNLPDYQVNRLDIGQLSRLGEKYGISWTIHLDENLDPCDFNTAVAEAYTLTALDAIDAAGRLGAPLVNMHLSKGVYFTLPKEKVYLYNRYFDKYMDSMLRFRHAAGEAAVRSGVTVCIENTGGFTPFQLRALDMLLEHPAFGLTYDTGHDHAGGGSDRREILARENHLRHMHLHDAAGRRDHLALGTGELDIHDRLALAQKHNCRAVLETKTAAGLAQSAEWLRSNGCL